MAFGEKARHYAMETIGRRRAEAAEITAENRAELARAFPETASFDARIASFGLSLARAAMRDPADADSLRREIVAAEEEKTRFLRSRGVADERIFPFSFCKKCRDTGYLDGGDCDCATRLMREYTLAEINRASPLSLCRFERFSLDYYPAEQDDRYGISPRDNMKNVLESCRQFVRGFPAGQNLLMMGDAGLGKTHLALSVAEKILSRFGVLYCSAAGIFRVIESEYFDGRRETGTIDSLKSCDLLVLDDLGAEFINAFTVSTLYDLINTRLSSKKSTIFTTNITKTELLETRYGEKISSRLIGCCKLLYFFGDDIRMKIK